VKDDKKINVELSEEEIKTLLMWKKICEERYKGKVCPLQRIAWWEWKDRVPCFELEEKLAKALMKLSPKAKEYVKEKSKEIEEKGRYIS